MKKIIALIVLTIVLSGVSPCTAAPYLLGYPFFKQPDGKGIVLKHIVDEFGYYYIADRGLAVQADDGSWRYGRYDNNHNLIPTSYLVGEENGNEYALDELRQQNTKKIKDWVTTIRGTASNLNRSGGVGKIAVNPASLAVLLVRFSDTASTTYNLRNN